MNSSTSYELHPLCTYFPRLSGSEFAALRDDIKANGLREPITLHDGMILDGGNRYRACAEAGIEPRFKTFDGGNIVSFVLSANLHRRHLTPGQQAAIVASAQDWAMANPQGRNNVTGNVAGDRIADRAAQSGAGERTQRMADKVAREAPDLAMKVAHGEVSLPKAHAQVAERAAVAVMEREGKSMGLATKRASGAERVEEMRVLAQGGHNAEQIAVLQGIGVEHARRLMNEAGIVIAMAKRGRAIDPNKIVRESVAALSGIAQGLTMAHGIDIDAAEANELLADLRSAMKALRMLDTTLKEIANG
jgi:hypothetical protein